MDDKISALIAAHMNTPLPSALIHMLPDAPYDPVKAHEYYLRTRQLKGRPTGQQIAPAGHRPSAKSTVVNKTAAKPILKTAPRRLSAAEEKKAVEARVAALQSKLDRLHKVLAALVKQAKARSGVKTPPSKAAAAKAAASGHNGSSKLTAAQKAEKAKKAKELYDKQKNTPAAQQEKELNDKIAAVTKKIEAMKVQIAAAKKETQIRTSSSVGARANHNK